MKYKVYNYKTNATREVEVLAGHCVYLHNNEAIIGDYTNRNLYSDNVNKPTHYNHNHKGVECIAAIEAALTPEEFRGYLKGNIIKYNWRERYKNGLEDLKKAAWYLAKLITLTEKEKNGGA